jgi:flagellar motility protein MotE (MotC chaperone)
MPQIIPPDQPQYDTLGRPIPPLPIAPIMQQQPAAMPSPIIAPVAQQQQQAPVTIPPQAPAAPAAPSFSPLPEGPAQAAYRTGVAQIPQRSDYQAHGLHRVLNAIAGGFAGAAGHPEAGRELADLPYTRAVEDYNRKSNALKVGADIETERQQEGIKQGTAETGADFKTGELKAKFDQLDINHQKAQEDIKKKDADIAQRDAQIKQMQEKIDISTKSEEDRRKKVEADAAYSLWRQQPGNQFKTDLQYLMTLPEDKQADALKLIKAKSEYTAVGSTGGRLATESAQVTPDMVASYNDLKDRDPVTALTYLKSLPAGAKTAMLRQAGIPETVPAREQERMFNAKITLGHVDNAIQMATDPDIAKNLGPIAGRIEILKGKIGTGEPDHLDYSQALANLAPDQARKMGEFLNYLNYMVVWESTTLSGTRPAQKLLESLRTTGARASMSQDRLLGALDAIKRSVNVTMTSIVPGSKSATPTVKAPQQGGFNWGDIKKVD